MGKLLCIVGGIIFLVVIVYYYYSTSEEEKRLVQKEKSETTTENPNSDRIKIKNFIMRKWEYKTIKFKPSQGIITKGFSSAEIERELNRIGEEGWELVNIFSAINPEYFWGGGKSSRTTEISCVFKRRRE